MPMPDLSVWAEAPGPPARDHAGSEDLRAVHDPHHAVDSFAGQGGAKGSQDRDAAADGGLVEEVGAVLVRQLRQFGAALGDQGFVGGDHRFGGAVRRSISLPLTCTRGK